MSYIGIVHDIDTIINYVWDNWEVDILPRPDIIFRKNSNPNDLTKSSQINRKFYRNSIELDEDVTDYSLLGFTGNVDKQNDTSFELFIYSKQGRDVAKANQDQFIKQIRALAKINDIGIYAYVQILSSRPTVSVFYTEYSSTIFLTRRGKGHDVS